MALMLLSHETRHRIRDARLSDFDISSTRGFLPEEDPLFSIRIPEEGVIPLQKVLVMDHFKEDVEKYFKFSVSESDIADSLESCGTQEIHALMRMFSFLTSAYVCG